METSPLSTITYTWPIDMVFLRASIYSNCGEPLVITSPTFSPGLYLELISKDGSKGFISLNLDPKSEEIDVDEMTVQMKITVTGQDLKLDTEGVLSKTESKDLQVAILWDSQLLDTEEELFEIVCEITYTIDMYSQSVPSYHLSKLANDLNQLRKKALFTDVILRTVGEDFSAHKTMLGARSPVFAAMFSHTEMTEAQDKVVDIPDVAAEVMEHLLNYIYCGSVAAVKKLAPEILVAADKYDVQPLIKVCVQQMLTNINVENAAKLFFTADLYRLEELKNLAMTFISQNPSEVAKTAAWVECIKSKPDLLEQLYLNLAEKK